VGSSLNSRIVAGSTVPGSRFGDKMAAILVARGAISPVSAPPLESFPGWKLRAKKFDEAGYDAISILETDDESLAFATGYQVKSIKKWKIELEDFLGLGKIKEVSGCSGCNDKEKPQTPEFLQVPPVEDLPEDELDESEYMEVNNATNND
jgi:hypothetical protein